MATIGCKHYNKTWQLQCEHSQWVGVVGRCNEIDNGLVPTHNDTSWFRMRTVAGIPMELIIIAIIGVVLFISICICMCILGQTIMAKRRQPQPLHFNTDTMPTHTGQHGDGGHVMTSSWFCSYPDEKPGSPHIWETPLPKPCTTHAEGDYTLPADMRHGQHNSEQTGPVAESVMPDNMQPDSQVLVPLTSVSDGGYTAPITIKVDDRQHTAVVAPQPMPEYTLPVKKQKQEAAPVCESDTPDEADDYLLPTKVRPDPIGENTPLATVLESSSVNNVGYRPDSVMVDS